MSRPYRILAPAGRGEAPGILGRVVQAGDIRGEIELCALQSIEPLFRAYLPPTGKILEAGAGRGRWVAYLRGLGYDVEGIEISPEELEAAKSFDPAIPITAADVLRTGLPDRSCAAVISLGVLEHFEEGPAQALGEVRRILADGGLLLVTVPTQNLARLLIFHRIKSAQNLLRRLRGVTLRFDEYRYTRRQFRRLLNDAGFTILATAPDDFLPPRCMGLYNDSRFLQDPAARWRLNLPGRCLRSLLDSFSPWLSCSGTLWVCRVS